MQRIAPEARIDITVTNQVPPFGADTKSGIVPLTLKLAGQNATYAVSYATEAGLFQLGGAPSIVCGPGNIAQAHTANEFLRIEELDKCLRFLGRLGGLGGDVGCNRRSRIAPIEQSRVPTP
jgi:acetylornithine deacetylase